MSYAFKVDFSDVQPVEPSWLMADVLARREFARLVVQLVLKAKDKELASGLDRFGRPLVPISEYTFKHRKSAMGPADPYAPPLTPAYGLSRTRSLLDGRAHLDHALFFWRMDPVTGKSWGRILGYHREGAGRLPVRDVIGLSPASLAWVKEQVARWWVAKQRMQEFYAQAPMFAVPVPLPRTLPRIMPPRIAPVPSIFRVGRSTYAVTAAEPASVRVYHTRRPTAAQVPMGKGDFRSGAFDVTRLRKAK